MTNPQVVDVVPCRVCRQLVKRPRALRRAVWDCPRCGSSVTDRKIVVARAPIVKRIPGQRLMVASIAVRLIGTFGLLFGLAALIYNVTR